MRHGTCGLLALIAAVLSAACQGCARVTIETDPPGAKLYQNGQYIGTSPYTGDFSIPAGIGCTTAAVLPGYTLEDCPPIVKGGAGIAGTALAFTSAPPGALCYKDGQFVGVSPGYDPVPTIPRNYRVVWPKEVLEQAKNHAVAQAGGIANTALAQGVSRHHRERKTYAGPGSKAHDLIERALAKDDAGDLTGALADYNQAEGVDPTHPLIFNNRGWVKKELKDLDGALADFNRAIELDGKYASPYIGRGAIKDDRKDFDGAMTDYNRAIELDPTDSAAYNFRGNTRKTKKDLDGALSDYLRAIELDPKDDSPLVGVGNVKLDRKEYDGAIAEYTRAIELDPKDAIGYSNRGLAKDRKKDYDGALADCNRAIDLDPKYERAYVNRGIARADKADVDGAFSDYTRAIELDPKDKAPYNNRGNLKQRRKDYDGAIADYTRAIELDPKDAMQSTNRGVAKRDSNDMDGAIADFNTAIEVDPKYARAYATRGGVRRERGDLDAALADYDKAVELDPDNAAQVTSRARFYYLRREWQKSLADFQKGCELDPKDQDYSRIDIWLIRALLSGQEAANTELAAYLDKRWNGAPNDWPTKITGFLLGKVSEAEFFAAAASSDQTTDRGQRCEAWFYAGMKRLLTNNKDGATDCFHKCLATEEKTYVEYEFAQAELKFMGKEAAPPATP